MVQTVNDNPRSGFLTPVKVISEMGLREGDVVIDFGSGSGFWSIPMAKIVGSKGLILAIDPYEENLRVLKDKAGKENLINIRYFKAPYSSKMIPVSEKADLILISNILSLIKTDKELLLSVKKNSKPGTKLVVIDWDKKSMLGPKDSEKIDIEEVILEVKKSGFEFKKLLPTGAHHDGLYFERGGK
jgi:ubiquinone/menaquinone biosynthesis C-methylase UbiE